MSQILPKEEAGRKRGELGLKRAYSDPLLRDRRYYARLVRHLASRGLIEFRRTCVEQVGLFSVWKKSGKVRLIVDCRLSNAHFGEPEEVHLASGASMGSIEVDTGEPVSLGQVDIATPSTRWPCRRSSSSTSAWRGWRLAMPGWPSARASR